MIDCSYCGKQLKESKQVQKSGKIFCDNICRLSFEKKNGKFPNESKAATTVKDNYSNKIFSVVNFLILICAIISLAGIAIKGQYIIDGYQNYNIIISFIVAILGMLITVDYLKFKKLPTLFVLTLWTVLQILSIYSQVPGQPETINALYEAAPFANFGFQIGNQINDNFSVYFQFNILQWIMLIFLSKQITVTKKQKL